MTSAAAAMSVSPVPVPVPGSWTWITSNDEESRRRAKSHVSREVRRHKVFQARQVRDKHLGRRRALVPTATKPKPEPRNKAEEPPSALVPWPGPVSLLGAGRVDPFALYPIHSTSSEHLQLVDHCESARRPPVRTSLTLFSHLPSTIRAIKTPEARLFPTHVSRSPPGCL